MSSSNGTIGAVTHFDGGVACCMDAKLTHWNSEEKIYEFRGYSSKIVILNNLTCLMCIGDAEDCIGCYINLLTNVTNNPFRTWSTTDFADVAVSYLSSEKNNKATLVFFGFESKSDMHKIWVVDKSGKIEIPTHWIGGSGVTFAQHDGYQNVHTKKEAIEAVVRSVNLACWKKNNTCGGPRTLVCIRSKNLKVKELQSFPHYELPFGLEDLDETERFASTF
ncbi:hypothetical protein ACHQM5_000807 [Ranunculus cassubicifolius]